MSSDSVNSKLGDARDRFLSAVVEHALSIGRRSAADFLRHFSPRDVMVALKTDPKLRAKILVPTVGINEKVALKKSAESAGEDLEIALAENVTDPGAVVALFEADDRVRFLDHAKLWAFVIEGEFWKTAEAAAASRLHLGFILEKARHEKLLSDRDVIEGIGFETLVSALPRADVVRLLEKAVSEGRAGRPFKDDRLLELLPPKHLLEHVRLSHVWERVIAPKLTFGDEQPEKQEGKEGKAAPTPTPVPSSDGGVVETPRRRSTESLSPTVSVEPISSREILIDEGLLSDEDEIVEEITANLDLDAALSAPQNAELKEKVTTARTSSRPRGR